MFVSIVLIIQDKVLFLCPSESVDVVSLYLHYDLLTFFVLYASLLWSKVIRVLHFKQFGGLTARSIHCALQRLKALCLALRNFMFMWLLFICQSLYKILKPHGRSYHIAGQLEFLLARPLCLHIGIHF